MDKKKKVFVFGIDGTPPKFVFSEWLDELPTIKKLMQNETWRDIWSGLWKTEVEAVFGCDNASHIIAAYDECVDWINTNWIDSDDCEIDFELPSSCQDIIFTINDKVDDNIED